MGEAEGGRKLHEVIGRGAGLCWGAEGLELEANHAAVLALDWLHELAVRVPCGGCDVIRVGGVWCRQCFQQSVGREGIGGSSEGEGVRGSSEGGGGEGGGKRGRAAQGATLAVAVEAEAVRDERAAQLAVEYAEGRGAQIADSNRFAGGDGCDRDDDRRRGLEVTAVCGVVRGGFVRRCDRCAPAALDGRSAYVEHCIGRAGV
eukprot:955267-Prymnesium_polylepis.1